MEAGLETDPGCAERIVDQAGSKEPVLGRVGHRVVDDRRDRHRVGEAEVRDRLPRRDHGKLDLDVGQKPTRPCSGCDDACRRNHLVTVRRHPDRPGANLDRRRAPVIQNHDAGLGCRGQQGVVGTIGQGDPSVGLVQRLLGRLGCDRPPCAHLGSGEELVSYAARGKSARVRRGNESRSRARPCARSAARHTRPRSRANTAARSVRGARDAGQGRRVGRSATRRDSIPDRGRAHTAPAGRRRDRTAPARGRRQHPRSRPRSRRCRHHVPRADPRGRSAQLGRHRAQAPWRTTSCPSMA